MCNLKTKSYSNNGLEWSLLVSKMYLNPQAIILWMIMLDSGKSFQIAEKRRMEEEESYRYTKFL